MTLKDMLREMLFGVNLFMAFIGLIVLELCLVNPPTMEQGQQHLGFFISFGLMSVWGLIWMLVQIVYFAYRIVRGPRQIKAKETV